MVKVFGATSFLVTITNCKVKTLTEEAVVNRLKAFLPPYKSLVIACEIAGKGHLHYHIFWDGKKKWQFQKPTWANIREFLGAANDDYKTWGKKMGISKKEWLVEKWRYCNNLVNSAFTEAKGDKKGQVWVYNDGNEYETQQEEEIHDLKPDAEILKGFCDGTSLTQQYSLADWTRKAYIAKNWDILTKMITNHKRILREIANAKPKFSKENFYPNKLAEEHDFTTKALVLRGPPNGGKTQYAKTFFKKPLLVRHPDKLKSFDENVHDGIIFDDQSYGHWPRESVIHLMDVEEEADINVKNSMVTIPAGTPRIFTTNRQMRVVEEDRFGKVEHTKDKSFLPARLDEFDTAIDRRLTVVTCGDLRKLPGRKKMVTLKGFLRMRENP